MMNRNQYKNIKLKLNDIYNNQKVNLSYFEIDDFIYDLSEPNRRLHKTGSVCFITLIFMEVVFCCYNDCGELDI